MTSTAIDEVSKLLKKDPVGDIMAFLEKENQKAREHEMKLLSMLANGYQGHQPYHMQFLNKISQLTICPTRGILMKEERTTIQILSFNKIIVLPCYRIWKKARKMIFMNFNLINQNNFTYGN